MKQRFWVWVLALVPILVVIGLGAGLLSNKLGAGSLLITFPVVAIVGIVFGKAMAKNVFGRRG